MVWVDVGRGMRTYFDSVVTARKKIMQGMVYSGNHPYNFYGSSTGNTITGVLYKKNGIVYWESSTKRTGRVVARVLANGKLAR